jgi:hypothetical protein
MEALLAASHDVVRSIDELGGGVDDPAVLAFASEHERVVVTYNAADFKLLADETPQQRQGPSSSQTISPWLI